MIGYVGRNHTLLTRTGYLPDSYSVAPNFSIQAEEMRSFQGSPSSSQSLAQDTRRGGRSSNPSSSRSMHGANRGPSTFESRTSQISMAPSTQQPSRTDMRSHGQVRIQETLIPHNTYVQGYANPAGPISTDTTYYQSYEQSGSSSHQPFQNYRQFSYSHPHAEDLYPTHHHTPPIGHSALPSPFIPAPQNVSPNLHSVGFNERSPSIQNSTSRTSSPGYTYSISESSACGHLAPQTLVGSIDSSPGPTPRRKPQCWEHGCNGREFSTFSNLLRHQRERNGTANKSICPHCGIEFTRTTARNGHLAGGKCKGRADGGRQ